MSVHLFVDLVLSNIVHIFRFKQVNNMQLCTNTLNTSVIGFQLQVNDKTKLRMLLAVCGGMTEKAVCVHEIIWMKNVLG